MTARKPGLIFVSSDPSVINFILRIAYLLENLIINQALRDFVFFFSFFGNAKPNRYLGLIVGLVISEVSYRIAVRHWDKIRQKNQGKLNGVSVGGVKIIKEFYIFRINSSIAAMLNIIFLAVYFLINKI